MTTVVQPAQRGRLAKIKDETEYFQHQADGIRLMARMQSFLLADEMGLGKSLQALTVAAIDFEMGLASKVLIVAPVSLKYNWADEIETHTNFSYMVLGAQKDRQGEWDSSKNSPSYRSDQLRIFRAADIDILIVNYEQVTSHLADFNAIGFDVAMFDEAHAIKNYASKRTKSCLKLRAKRSFIITGSPLLNQVNELWPLLHKINPSDFPDYWRFVNRYCVKGGFQGKQIINVKNKHELQSKLDTLMIRRLKKDVLDLPDKVWIPVPVDFHPNQKKMYDQARNELRIDRWEDDPDPMVIDNALTKALRLKQISGTTYAVNGEDDSYKLDQAVEMCKAFVRSRQHPDGHTEPGEWITVWSQFVDVQYCLRDRLMAEGIPVMVMNGETTKPDQRVAFVKEWENRPEPTVLIAGIQVAGVGLNMTKARRCIFLDKLWVPKLNEQVEDRHHRIGATGDFIQIFHIFVRNSIEGRVETILKKKRKLFDSLVEESDWKRALYQALIEDEQEAMAV